MPTRATLNRLKRSRLYLRIGVALLFIYIVVVTTLVLFQVLYLRSDLVMEQEQAREDFEHRIDKSLTHIKSEHERTHQYIYCIAQALTTENGEKAIAGLESCGISIEVDKDSVSYTVPTPSNLEVPYQPMRIREEPTQATPTAQQKTEVDRKDNQDNTVVPKPKDEVVAEAHQGEGLLPALISPVRSLLNNITEAL